MSFIPNSWQEKAAEKGESAAVKILAKGTWAFNAESNSGEFSEETLDAAREAYFEAAGAQINKLDRDNKYSRHDVDYCLTNAFDGRWEEIVANAIPVRQRALLNSFLQQTKPAAGKLESKSTKSVLDAATTAILRAAVTAEVAEVTS